MSFYRTHALFLTVVLLCCFIGCEINTSTNKSINKINLSAAHEILSADEYEHYNKMIEDAHPKFENFTLYTHSSYPNEAAAIYQIGIEGLPVLITKTNDFTEEMLKVGDYDETKYDSVEDWKEKAKSSIEASRYEEFLTSCVYTLLRTDTIDANSVTGKQLHDCLNLLLYESTVDCKNIINGNWGTKEKLIELRRFGILAIPYVVKEIEKGNYEYEEYFTLIGLHLSTYDFAEYMYGNVSSTDPLQVYELIQNDPRAENFNSRVWLSENKDALDKLFTFVNSFTSCYEPQSDIRYSTFNIKNDEY